MLTVEVEVAGAAKLGAASSADDLLLLQVFTFFRSSPSSSEVLTLPECRLE